MRSSGLEALLLTLLLAAACDDAADPPASLWSGPQEPGERTFVERSWEKAWEIGEGDEPLLASPLHLTARDSVVVWWDGYLHRVQAVDTAGRILWSFGREGEGPGEFGSVGDVEIDGDGSVVVLDSDNGRFVRISPEGRHLETVPLPEGYWRGLVLVPDGSMILYSFNRSPPFVRVSGTGEAIEEFGPPWEPFEDLSTLQSQGRLVSAVDGRWLYGFMLGNGWFPFDGSEPLGYTGRSIEHVDFPQVVRVSSGGGRVTRMASRPNCTMCAGVIEGDTLVVLFGGQSEHLNRVLDRYGWSDGRYMDSVLLPRRASEMARTGGLTILYTASPLPTLSAFRAVEVGSAEGPVGGVP